MAIRIDDVIRINCYLMTIASVSTNNFGNVPFVAVSVIDKIYETADGQNKKGGKMRIDERACR